MKNRLIILAGSAAAVVLTASAALATSPPPSPTPAPGAVAPVDELSVDSLTSVTVTPAVVPAGSSVTLSTAPAKKCKPSETLFAWVDLASLVKLADSVGDSVALPKDREAAMLALAALLKDEQKSADLFALLHVVAPENVTARDGRLVATAEIPASTAAGPAIALFACGDVKKKKAVCLGYGFFTVTAAPTGTTPPGTTPPAVAPPAVPIAAPATFTG